MRKTPIPLKTVKLLQKAIRAYQERVWALPAPEAVKLPALVALGERAGSELVDRCPVEAAEILERACAVFLIFRAFVDEAAPERKRQWR
jgi:hypothetical protein